MEEAGTGGRAEDGSASSQTSCSSACPFHCYCYSQTTNPMVSASISGLFVVLVQAAMVYCLLLSVLLAAQGGRSSSIAVLVAVQDWEALARLGGLYFRLVLYTLSSVVLQHSVLTATVG
jgi:hypothetical protein